jgi:hypothetical protein
MDCAGMCVSDKTCTAFSVLDDKTCLLSSEQAVSTVPSPGIISGYSEEPELRQNWCIPSKGGRLHFGHLNNDTRLDMICHNATTQTLRFALSQGRSFYFPADQSYPQCPAASNVHLIVGDFDGNGISDIYCDAPDTKKVFSFLDSSQKLATTWTWSSTWCTDSPVGYIDIGTFRNNGKQQLMCHNFQIGNVYLLDIQATRPLHASYNLGYCLKSTSQRKGRLIVGHLNSDKYDDLICHWKTIATGVDKIAVRFGSSTGSFGIGKDVLDVTKTCPFGSYLELGHFNADGLPDFVCITGTGAERKMRIFLAKDANGKFTGSDWEGSFSWCDSTSSKIYPGDFRGIGRSQFLCHGQDGSMDIMESPYNP